VRYAVVLHVLMSQAEMELWRDWADCCRLEVDDVVHVTAPCGLKDQLGHVGDEVGAHAAEVCQRELIARHGVW
jgi:hypothetical protein